MTIEKLKPVTLLTVSDLQDTSVWQFTNRDGADETFVRAVKNVPVKKMTGKIIGTRVRLANGAAVWALIGNIDPDQPRLTEHFLTLSILRNGEWFNLARYHDFDYADRGPEALAHFLNLPMDDVFPISFDVRQYAQGNPAALAGSIQKQPREKLSRAEIIAMAVP